MFSTWINIERTKRKHNVTRENNSTMLETYRRKFRLQYTFKYATKHFMKSREEVKISLSSNTFVGFFLPKNFFANMLKNHLFAHPIDENRPGLRRPTNYH